MRNVTFITFLGAYAAAVIAGIISHVPGGIGVFETVIILAMPQRAAERAARLACWPIAPCTTSCRWSFGTRSCSVRRNWKRARASRAGARAGVSMYIAPVVPQVAGTLTFLAGALLLISGATPAIDARLALRSTACCRWPCSRCRTWPAA